MANTASNTIILRSNGPDNAMQRVREAPAQAAITPGMLLEWGTTNTVKAHATAAGNLQGRKVAIENPWSDHGSGKAIDHAYAASETVGFIFAQMGDQLYMTLASGQNVAKGAALESDGNGNLQAHTAPTIDEVGGESGDVIDSDVIVGYAAEAVDASGGALRIRVDIR